jgi:DtxR family Mn-dependent transcriptional regulator
MASSSPRANTEAVENYLKTIYGHTEWQPDPITPSALATRLGLVPSSVTEMVAKLAEQGLVDHVKYGSITLTATGRSRALQVVRRHRLIETYLVEVLGYSWDEVHDEAEVLEHAVSDRFLEAIENQLDYPDRDPHGDPIPSATGWVPVVSAILLQEAATGTSGAIVRISDRDPAVLRLLDSVGIGLDSRLTIEGPGSLIRAGGESVDLSSAATAIWITAPVG